MPNPQTNLRLNPAIRDRAIAAAKAKGLSLSALVESALDAYLAAGDICTQPAIVPAIVPTAGYTAPYAVAKSVAPGRIEYVFYETPLAG